ncbi:hypothetical protein [Kordiimonas sp.]|uniref:hypothetical protein n=1 Tax=Kordiimonas sp. TaxID=1970157 RepID=UPI003A8CB312
MERHLYIAAVMIMSACFALAGPLRASESISLGGPSIEGVFAADGVGPYWDFFTDVTRASPLKVDIRLLPIKRYTRSLFSREVDCLYMASDDEIFYTDHGAHVSQFLVSPSFNRINLHAFTLKSRPLIRDMAGLEGKAIVGDDSLHASTIALRRLPFLTKIHYAPTVDDTFELAMAGRAQVVISYMIDAEEYFARAGQPAFHADPSFILLSLGERFTCWPSDKAERFIAYVSERIDLLRERDELKQKYGFSMP